MCIWTFPRKQHCTASDEHEERFNQQISDMEERYLEKWSESMLANYCWALMRKSLATEYKRQAKRLRLHWLFVEGAQGK